jgi:hypothetical protein
MIQGFFLYEEHRHCAKIRRLQVYFTCILLPIKMRCFPVNPYPALPINALISHFLSFLHCRRSFRIKRRRAPLAASSCSCAMLVAGVCGIQHLRPTHMVRETRSASQHREVKDAVPQGPCTGHLVQDRT